jgi:hypothetical protein
MAKAQDPPSPVDAYEAPPPPIPAGEPTQSEFSTTPEYALTPAKYAPAQYTSPSRDPNILAIVALIASCFGFAIPGIAMGYIALSQIKKSGEAGHGIALAAVIVGWVLLGVVLAAVAAYVIFFVWIFGITNSAVNDFGNLG